MIGELIVAQHTERHNDLHGSGVLSVVPSEALCVVREINSEHRLARSDAQSAVNHAIRCGELLLEQKKALPHGEFMRWIGTNCEFSQPTASRYIKAAQEFSHGVEIRAVRHLFVSGQIGQKRPTATKTAAPAEPTATAPALERERPAESNINAAQPSLTIEEAMRMVAKNRAFSNLKSEVCANRNLVARRKIVLAKAERKLADAEAALVHAAMKLQAQKKNRP